MSINKHYKANFGTLKLAAENEDLALMECQDKKTGAVVMTVCAVHRDDEGQFVFVPLAKMFDGDPYEELNPPNPEGGFHA